VYVSPGGTSEKIHIFFIEVDKKVSDGGGIEDENILSVELTLDEVKSMMENKEIEDAKTLLGLLYVMPEFHPLTNFRYK
jgi:ADP-ribose pyrophosphatase